MKITGIVAFLPSRQQASTTGDSQQTSVEMNGFHCSHFCVCHVVPVIFCILRGGFWGKIVFSCKEISVLTHYKTYIQISPFIIT